MFKTLTHIISHPLNEEKKLIALYRYLYWQTISRISNKDIEWNWIENAKLNVRNGETNLTGNIYCGLYEFEGMAFLLHVLKSEDAFVDTSANVGSYTILSSAVAKAKTYAFEAVPERFYRLRKNIQINNLDEIAIANNLALGDEEGTRDILTNNRPDPDSDTDPGEVDQAENISQIQISTLDKEIYAQPFMIKIGPESEKLKVLTGAKKILENQSLSAVMIELNETNQKNEHRDQEIIDIMISNSFEIYHYKPFERKLIKIDPNNRQAGTTLFLRNIDDITSRIENANPIYINGMTI